jgi:hypothetical protein
MDGFERGVWLPTNGWAFESAQACSLLKGPQLARWFSRNPRAPPELF